MHNEGTLLIGTGGIGLIFGFAALAAGVHGVAAILCSLVFALAALCLFTGWRHWSHSPLTRYRARRLQNAGQSARGEGN